MLFSNEFEDRIKIREAELLIVQLKDKFNSKKNKLFKDDFFDTSTLSNFNKHKELFDLRITNLLFKSNTQLNIIEEKLQSLGLKQYTFKIKNNVNLTIKSGILDFSQENNHLFIIPSPNSVNIFFLTNDYFTSIEDLTINMSDSKMLESWASILDFENTTLEDSFIKSMSVDLFN